MLFNVLTSESLEFVCPECGYIQEAEISICNVLNMNEKSHECDNCQYLITENEWVGVED